MKQHASPFSQQTPRSFWGNLQRTQHLNTVLFLAPWGIVLGVFWVYPLAYALYLSFTKYETLRNESTWIGIQNYAHILHDSFFWLALKNTAIFSAGTIPLTTVFALALAVGVSSIPRFQGFFRAAFFLPSVTSLIVLALVFSRLYAANGYLASLCQMLGIPFPARGLLQDISTALPAIMAMDIAIATGYYMVIFLAALQTIPRDIYESAELAGANAWAKFWRITLPLMRPTLLFVLIINTIRSFQIFVEIYIMTRGGPLSSTSTLIYLVYQHAFDKFDMGYASALAYIVFAIILCFSLVQMWFLRLK
ncbi:MAG: sugar ABC transporter permease [Candidatus Kapaibacterium sp.]|nr:MAG: sugar ABC transporter permease [Candidatus Kapabacteria bacterium]